MLVGVGRFFTRFVERVSKKFLKISQFDFGSNFISSFSFRHILDVSFFLDSNPNSDKVFHSYFGFAIFSVNLLEIKFCFFLFIIVWSQFLALLKMTPVCNLNFLNFLKCASLFRIASKISSSTHSLVLFFTHIFLNGATSSITFF